MMMIGMYNALTNEIITYVETVMEAKKIAEDKMVPYYLKVMTDS